jgi:predicted negative regulator of RcsB-dependent stress response
MANVSLARKKELNEPDEFITMSNKALEYARQNRNTIIGVIAGAVILMIMVAGFQYYAQNRESRAFTRYAEDMRWYESAIGDSDGQPPLSEIRQRADGFFKDFSGTAAAMLARARYAGIYFDEKDFGAAAGLYEGLLSDVDHDPALKNIALCALAQCYQAMKENDRAVTRYEEVLAGTNAIKKDEALFHLGMIYAEKGDAEKSQAAYARIVNEFSDSMYIDMARERIQG